MAESRQILSQAWDEICDKYGLKKTEKLKKMRALISVQQAKSKLLGSHVFLPGRRTKKHQDS